MSVEIQLQDCDWRLRSGQGTSSQVELIISPRSVIKADFASPNGRLYLDFAFTLVDALPPSSSPRLCFRGGDTCHIADIEIFREGLQAIQAGRTKEKVELQMYEGEVALSLSDLDPTHALALVDISFYQPSAFIAKSTKKSKNTSYRDHHVNVVLETTFVIDATSMSSIVEGTGALLRRLNSADVLPD